MSIPLLVPLEGLDQMGEGPFALDSLVGIVMFIALLAVLAAAALHLRRTGFSPSAWLASRQSSPETAAKEILAERFARGDISSDEFMERASALNWTPGGTDPQHRRRLNGR